MMRRFVLRRLALVPFTLLGAALLVFAMLRLVPGDPVEIMLGESAAPADVAALRHDLGLDLPLPAQLARFLGRLARGDLGDSLAFHAPVARVIAARYPATLELALAALLLAVAGAVPVGALAATRPSSPLDRTARLVSLAGVCLPTFVVGPLLVLAFAIRLGWLPPSGRGGIAHLVLPAATLALGMAGILVRLARARVRAALAEDHVRTARAKGASPLRVLVCHALPSALPALLAVIALEAGALLGGAIIVETIFGWPGLGRLVVQAIAARDYPLVQGCVLAIAASYVAANAVGDLLHGALDPRLRDAGS
jgi:peptide/nickel transport system permease protein